MKIHSMQFRFLITVVAAMLSIAIFVGGQSIYEVDKVVQQQTEELIKTTGEKEAAQINAVFKDMEKSVRIIESYVLDLVEKAPDIENRSKQNEMIKDTDEMFADVVENTDGVIAYYLRFAPEISDSKTGLFYSKVDGGEDYVPFEITDLSRYSREDTEHVGWFWQPYEAGEALWMQPYYNLNNDVLMISYVVPLYYDGRFIGVVGMDFDYTVLTDRVHNIKIYEHGFAHLEFDGAVTHGNGKDSEIASGDYLQASETLRNGMTLVLSASYNDIRQIRYSMAYKLAAGVLLLTAVTSVMVVFAVRRIVAPLEKLTEASEKLSDGNYDVEIVHGNTREIKLLSTAFENMTRNLREHEEYQRRLAYHDPLTGLQNTTAFKEWAMEFDEALKNDTVDFGVVVLDVNGLKEVNDRDGHDAGNALIVAAARVISRVFQRSPVFRIGGDEFMAFLQGEDLKEYEALLEKINLECEKETVCLEERNVAVSLARGFARYDPDNDLRFADTFNRADAAMYKNKRIMKANMG